MGLPLGWRVSLMGTQVRWPRLGLGTWAPTKARAALPPSTPEQQRELS